MRYRKGKTSDVPSLKALGLKSWTPFKHQLTPENWQKLFTIINSDKTYADLLDNADCFVCENEFGQIIGMAFLVSSGNPTEIYDASWCYIRFVSVDQDYRGNGIGRTLTEKCLELARKNNEKIVALHTSEIMKPAIHIYESLGFKILKEIQPRLGVRYWIFTKDLD